MTFSVNELIPEIRSTRGLTYRLHGKSAISNWKIKWLTPFRLGIFRNHGLSFKAMQFFYSYSFPLISMYIVAGGSPTTSKFYVHARRISTRVVCVNSTPGFLKGLETVFSWDKMEEKHTKGLFAWRLGTPGRWGSMWRSPHLTCKRDHIKMRGTTGLLAPAYGLL